MQKTFNSFIKKELNAQQQKAVLQKNGSMLVVAGAGSGKTRVITARIAHLLINQGIEHHAIVALTFTNKAAKEMQERIKIFLEDDTDIPFIGTFHSYCVRLLKMNQELLDTPFFSIIDTDDQEKIIKGIMQRNNISKHTTAKQLLYQISSLKNQALTKEERLAQMIQYPLLQEVYQAYEQEKKASKCLDFDDLLHQGLSLFEHRAFKEQFQDDVRHILVDEYQDTNVVQHELLKAMTKKGKRSFAIDSICVVGDEDQSIYSWRGATVTNMVNFKKDFPKTKIIKIEQNYRSVQSILDVANHVIKCNKQRNPKKLWSAKKGNNRIRSITSMSEYQEGDAIAHLCTVASGTIKLSSCAVLYRTHFQSRAIEEGLIRQGIPYKIIGGIQFYERKEIKDLLAYLRLIINPFDRPSLFRVINCPLRGLGQALQTMFYELWAQEPFLTFVQIAQKMIQTNSIKGKKAVTLQNFIDIYGGIEPKIKPIKALEYILNKTNYIVHLNETNEVQEAEARTQNVKELVRAIAHFETEKIDTLDAFLQEVSLMQERANKQQEEQDALLLMTLHASKGLEFDTVILAGLEEGLLPSSKSINDEDAIEEERRLFYVGITRAKERLLLSKARYRYTFGQMSDQMPSRFLKEIPEDLVIAHNIGHLQPYEIKQWFGQWLGVEQETPTILTFGKNNRSKTIKNPVVKQSKERFTGAFKINQPVSHKTFGIGIIKKIEKRQDKTYVTVRFKQGTKKVLSSFLTTI